jgi:hypothetical protein
MSSNARKVLARSLLVLLAGIGACNRGPVYRHCNHGGGVYLSAHSEEPIDPPHVPMPFGGASPPGFRSARYQPVIVKVTVHNTWSYPVEVNLHCGTNNDLRILQTVKLQKEQETDLIFPVQRRGDGLSVKFSCEITDWVSQ